MIYDSYNSVIGINPGDSTGETQIYHKIRLTPFGERIPFMDLFAFARKWLEWGVGISSWDKGKEQIAIDIKNQKVRTKTAPVICIESIYPDFVRNYVDLGAEFITIVTNDAWYNYTFGPEQHYLIAAMRAIETRRYVARAANSGVTGFIGANGETILRAPQYESVGIAASIPLLNGKSIYVLFGEWLVFISLAVSAFAITVTFVKQK
jgi:apolipoprotein N-acyltransferase